MKWTPLGTRNGRRIRIACPPTFAAVANIERLKAATVLVVFDIEYTDDVSQRALIRSLLARSPLALAVHGAGSKVAFDAMIDLVSSIRDLCEEHVMTWPLDDLDLADAGEVFLTTVLPNEERWDTWRRHDVIVIGERSFLPLVAILRRFADKP